MNCTIIKAEGFDILELFRESVYEYYVRPYGTNDYKFAFAVSDSLTDGQLRVLVANGYFNHFEEE